MTARTRRPRTITLASLRRRLPGRPFAAITMLPLIAGLVEVESASTLIEYERRWEHSRSLRAGVQETDSGGSGGSAAVGGYRSRATAHTRRIAPISATFFISSTLTQASV